MKKLNINKIYGFLGKTMCSAAGAILGSFIAGPIAIIPGAIIGLIAGRFLEKLIPHPTNTDRNQAA